MPNPFGAPELTAEEVAQKCLDKDDFVWLDVREPNELAFARIDIDGIELLPLSRLASQQLGALPDSLAAKERPIVVMCHHGIRSAQVVVWLQQNGWENVYNLAGGIDAWAKTVDTSVGSY